MKRLLLTILTVATAAGWLAGAPVNAVVEQWEVEVNCRDAHRVFTRHHSVTRILNEHGKSLARFSFTLSDNEKLNTFKVTVSDGNGTVIKRIKKGDLERSELSPELASSAYTLSLKYTPPRYPVVIEKEWVTESDGSTLEFEPFQPVDRPGVSLSHATYELRLPPPAYSVHYSISGPAALADKIKLHTTSDETTGTIITASLDSVAATISEPFMPPSAQVLPMVRFVPDWINYLGTTGKQSTWSEASRWLASLMANHDRLPADFAARLHAAADTCSTLRGKVEQAKRLLLETTRYVSIQLGIGGLRPMPAAKVCDLAMGDCKGLSNFMRVMLAELGINATCAAIRMGNRAIDTDLPGTTQFNHMVLRVNLPDDTLWVECTDPTLPLGYVHNDIAGNHALAIADVGGDLVTVTSRADSLNRIITECLVNVHENGDASVNISRQYVNGAYEKARTMAKAKPDEQRHMLMDGMRDIKTYRVEEVKVEQHATAFEPPVVTVDAKIEATRLCSRAGRRLFVSALPAVNRYTQMHDNGRREHPVYIAHGLVEEHHCVIVAPDGYQVDELPTAVNVEAPMGNYRLRAVVSDDRRSATVTSRLELRSGTYDAVDYSKLCDLLNTAYNKSSTVALMTQLSEHN